MAEEPPEPLTALDPCLFVVLCLLSYFLLWQGEYDAVVVWGTPLSTISPTPVNSAWKLRKLFLLGK